MKQFVVDYPHGIQVPALQYNLPGGIVVNLSDWTNMQLLEAQSDSDKLATTIQQLKTHHRDSNVKPACIHRRRQPIDTPAVLRWWLRGTK